MAKDNGPFMQIVTYLDGDVFAQLRITRYLIHKPLTCEIVPTRVCCVAGV